jgi:hypothetical protein
MRIALVDGVQNPGNLAHNGPVYRQKSGDAKEKFVAGTVIDIQGDICRLKNALAPHSCCPYIGSIRHLENACEIRK